MLVTDMAREVAEFASDDLISYMLNQRPDAWAPAVRTPSRRPRDFAALFIYRLGWLPSDRSSIVQVRLERRLVDRLRRRPAGHGHRPSDRVGAGQQAVGGQFWR